MEAKACRTTRAINKSKGIKFMAFDEIAAIIQSRDSEKLKEVIREGRIDDINMVGGNNYTSLLMIACRGGFIECAKVLLDHNANINYQTKKASVLKSACMSGNVDMLRFLIERNIKITDRITLTCFDSASILGNTEITAILIEYINDVNWEEGRGSFLHKACNPGYIAIVLMLLERGALLTVGDWDALVAAALNSHLEVVNVLLEWNAATERISPDSVKKALKLASRAGYIDIVQALIEYGTNVGALTSALSKAIEGNRVEVASYLLDHGADFNAVPRNQYSSPWIYACTLGRPAMVRLFLDRGADVNAVDDKGWSPLKAALSHPKVLELLLEHKANPNLPLPDHRKESGSALLEVVGCSYKDYTQALNILLKYGADTNLAHTATGDTPLMRAARYASLNIVRLLLEHGADVNQENNEGKSVLDLLGQSPKCIEVRKLCTEYIDLGKPVLK